MKEDDRVELSPIERLAEHLSARPFQPPCDDPIREMADWLDYSLNRCCLVVVEEQSLARASLQGADTVTEAVSFAWTPGTGAYKHYPQYLNVGSRDSGLRVVVRAPEYADRNGNYQMGQTVSIDLPPEVARDLIAAMRAAAPTAQDDTGARLDAVARLSADHTGVLVEALPLLSAAEESLSKCVDQLFAAGARDTGMLASQASACVGNLKQELERCLSSRGEQSPDVPREPSE